MVIVWVGSVLTLILAIGLEAVDLVLVTRGVLGVAEASGADFLASRISSPSIDLFCFIIYNYNMTAIKLTKKQLAVLNYIEDFVEENGYAPSYREIMTGLSLTSVSAVAEHVDNLVAKGVLRKNSGEARSLEVLDYRHEETVMLFKNALTVANEDDKKILEKAADILGIDLA